jgi:hypothetical protein
MRIVMLGIDLGKNLCSLAGLDETGAVVLRRRMKRASVLPFTVRTRASLTRIGLLLILSSRAVPGKPFHKRGSSTPLLTRGW